MRYLILFLLVFCYACSSLAPQLPPRTSAASKARRESLKKTFILVASCTASASPALATAVNVTTPTRTSSTIKTNPPTTPPRLKALNVTEVLVKDKVVLRRLDSPLTETVVDPVTLNQYKEFRFANNWPKKLRPPRWKVKDTSLREAAIAGAVGGALTEVVRTSVLFPISTIKTRLQVATNESDTTLSDLTRNVYGGIIPAALISVPSAATWFGTRDLVKDFIATSGGDASRIAAVVLASGIAGLADVSVRAPVDLIVTRSQASSTGIDTSWLDLDQDGKVTKEELSLSLGSALQEGWRKVPTLVVTDLPFSLARTATYLTLKQSGALSDVLSGIPNSTTRDSLLLVLCTSVCALLTTPLDVARTKLIVEKTNDSNVIECLQGIVREEGAKGLMKGVLLRTIYWGVIVAAITPLRSLGYTAFRDVILLNT
ncbi:hypothetical protein TrST_g1508 [Triparma strigata]|uniref:EF-hand domain-containing protein n=1 Tax=Triparma strigata TaxID=1606541 RepID=A0A9W7B9Y6_9STRA|nr:hypothetical protein TrST_g1508 [Triparma strigata]